MSTFFYVNLCETFDRHVFKHLTSRTLSSCSCRSKSRGLSPAVPKSAPAMPRVGVWMDAVAPWGELEIVEGMVVEEGMIAMVVAVVARCRLSRRWAGRNSRKASKSRSAAANHRKSRRR